MTVSSLLVNNFQRSKVLPSIISAPSNTTPNHHLPTKKPPSTLYIKNHLYGFAAIPFIQCGPINISPLQQQSIEVVQTLKIFDFRYGLKGKLYSEERKNFYMYVE